ncbi:MAG: protein-tyrosine-phosphatase [Cyclobacteriaceae bacterium]
MPTSTKLLPKIQSFVDTLDTSSIPDERKEVLQLLINFVQEKKDAGDEINLNFICTHNSRRSQFSQVWGKTAAYYHGIDINSFSGGVEVTAFNERAVESIKRTGFGVTSQGAGNPIYSVTYAQGEEPLKAFSKVFDDPANAENFAAVMTCSHADENCPFIPGAQARLPVRYEDPKAFDDTPQESEKYEERSRQIATELFYVFSQIK